jgi:hypothetical protein
MEELCKLYHSKNNFSKFFFSSKPTKTSVLEIIFRQIVLDPLNSQDQKLSKAMHQDFHPHQLRFKCLKLKLEEHSNLTKMMKFKMKQKC